MKKKTKIIVNVVLLILLFGFISHQRISGIFNPITSSKENLNLDNKFSIDWETTINNSDFEIAKDLVKTDDNGFIIAGCKRPATINLYCIDNGKDAFVVKVDAHGNMLWNKTFGGSEDDEITSIVKTPDRNYILAGETASYGAGGKDVWILKIDSDGNVLWNKTFGWADQDRGLGMKIFGNNILVTGLDHPVVGESGQMFLLKMDQDGKFIWNRSYPDTHQGFDIVLASDSGYLLSGEENGDYLILKVDGNGNHQWSKSFGGNGFDISEQVLATPDNGFLIAGNTQSFGAKGVDAWFIKIDKDGNQEWNRTFGGNGDEFPSGHFNLIDGGYLIQIHSTSYGNGDHWILKLNSNGDAEWNQTIGYPTGDDFGHGVIKISEKTFVLAGRTNGGINSDFWIFQLTLNLEGTSSGTSSSSNNPSSISDQTSPGFVSISLISVTFLYFLRRRKKINNSFQLKEI